MIYLSKLVLNPHSRQVHSDLSNAYELHRTLSCNFGIGEDAYREARCLFRIETASNQVMVLVQSLVEPAWESLVNKDTYLLQRPLVKELDWQATGGECLRFRLRANPTKRVSNSIEDDELAGKRVQLFREEEQLTWLKRKGEASGFEVMDCQISMNERQKSRKGGIILVHQAVLFDGKLRVTDPERLKFAHMNGIGSAKGFGFGLLSLARR